MKIITNNVPRQMIYGYELPESAKSEFDYIPAEDFDSHDFVLYKGHYYAVSEFMRIRHNEDLKGWDGYSSDSAFSGVLIKILPDNGYVIMGRYFS